MLCLELFNTLRQNIPTNEKLFKFKCMWRLPLWRLTILCHKSHGNNGLEKYQCLCQKSTTTMVRRSTNAWCPEQRCGRRTQYILQRMAFILVQLETVLQWMPWVKLVELGTNKKKKYQVRKFSTQTHVWSTLISYHFYHFDNTSKASSAASWQT